MLKKYFFIFQNSALRIKFQSFDLKNMHVYSNEMNKNV